MPKRPRKKVTDDSLMEWGEHKGTRMEDVPAEHLLWLFRQPWIREWPDLHAYLVENQAALLQELGEDQPDHQHGEGFTSLEDYLRFGRD